MKSLINTILLLLILTSCFSPKGIKFEAYEAGKKVKYFIDIPDGYQITKRQGEVFKEYHFIYPDGAIFYYTNDHKSGGDVNKDKIEKYGKNILIKIAVNDTLDISGCNINGKFWREKKKYNFIVGYINASKKRKIEFDKAISTMQRKPGK